VNFMSDTAVTLQIWGKVLISNKLITQERWDECLALHKRAGGGTPIATILAQKNYLTAKGIDVVGKKVTELASKQSAPAAAPAKPAVAAPPKQVVAPVIAPPKQVIAPVHNAAKIQPVGSAAPATAAPAGKAGDTIDIGDTGGDSVAAHWRGSEADWVDGDGGGKKPVRDEAELANDERIELVGEDELTTSPGQSKIVVDNRPHIKDFARAKTQPKVNKKPAAEGEEASHDDEARMESPVAPNDMDPEAFQFLTQAVKMGASDLHLASGSPPFMRLHGTLKFFDAPKLTAERAQRMVLGFMDDPQQQRYLRTHDVDFAYEHPDLGRFRVNALEEFRGPDIIFRIIPKKVPSLSELGLPQSLEKFTEWHQGLVLVTGPAGCGKSTTAAALIDVVNSHRKDHIITVEDPVEFLHKSKNCNVTQRQVLIHTQSFVTALKAALREDPDVIMIGEMRDLETVSLAIRAAETGHLVIGTLQTKSAARTIDRVVDVFPADQQAQIRTMLSESLRGIISQQLIPRADGRGRVVSLEVLHVNTAVSNLIRDSKTFQLPSLMQTGRKIGQKLMDDSLEELLTAGTITRDDAIKAADNPKRFRKEGLAMADAPAKK